MYSICLFCHTPLGENESIEEFPIGRRLAFDPARGRLWAVCRNCERWNLTPIEERWEAIESCERLFRDTRTRVSTDQIGLCKVREGLELVRIGEPQRPEMAAWRYGDQFGRRRRRYALTTVAAGAAGAGVIAGGLAIGLTVGSIVQGPNLLYALYKHYHVAARVHGEDGVLRAITPDQLKYVGIAYAPDGTVALRFRHRVPRVPRSVSQRGTALMLSLWNPRGSIMHWSEQVKGDEATVRGDPAMRALSVLLPHVNRRGGSAARVQRAVDAAVTAGGAPQLLSRVATSLIRGAETASLFAAAPELRLALEMSLHESQERAAMEGELAALEDRWREAEEIAAISDDMFLSPGITEALNKLRGRP